MSIKSLVDKIKATREGLKELEKEFKLVVERNVQQTSGGTFFVCVPKEWAEKVGLQKGAKVTLVWSRDDSLTVIT